MRLQYTLTTTLCFSVFISSPAALSAQDLAFGVVGGVALTDDFRTESSAATVLGGNSSVYSGTVYTKIHSNSKDYVVGAMAELRLPARFSIKIDGLYRPMNFITSTSSVSFGVTSPSNTVVTWEFPVLLKYRFQTPRVRPFLDIGPTFRTSGNLNDTAPSNHGVAAGTGLQTSLRKLGILAEGRYTRWAVDGSTQEFQPRTKPNQVEFLTAWFFHAKRQ